VRLPPVERIGPAAGIQDGEPFQRPNDHAQITLRRIRFDLDIP